MRTKNLIVDKTVDNIVNTHYDYVMSSIQVRIDETTHKTIKSLANSLGESMQSVVERAIERFRREIFLESLSGDFANLRSNADSWKSEIDERTIWESTLSDGEKE